jgi:hypothetical protein
LTPQILTSSIKEFVCRLGSEYKALYSIDGCAGAGIYEDWRVAPEYGSPILIAEFAKRLVDTDKSFILKCLHVGGNRWRFRRLQEAAVAYSDHVTEKHYHPPFIILLDEILLEIGGAPSMPVPVVGKRKADAYPPQTGPSICTSFSPEAFDEWCYLLPRNWVEGVSLTRQV